MAPETTGNDVSRLVTIGLPAYNRPRLLQTALESLQAQTYRNIEILVSDNASPDPEVARIVERLARDDNRIRYRRRDANYGAAANFKSVLDCAASPYFMWASDDDVWERHFVERCLSLLDQYPRAQMAFGTVDNINLDDVTVRRYEGFSKYMSTGINSSDALRFVHEAEIFGKANLVYGLFRTAAIREVVKKYWEAVGFERWGGDIVLIFAFICRYPIACSDEVLLHKRVISRETSPIDPRVYFVPPMEFASYVRRHVAVAPNWNIALRTAGALARRSVVETFGAMRQPAFWQKVSQCFAERRPGT